MPQISVTSNIQIQFQNVLHILANSVNANCRPSKLIAIPFFKIIIDALGQGAIAL